MVRKTIFSARKEKMSVAELDSYWRDQARTLIESAAPKRAITEQMPEVFRELASRTGLTAARIASYFHKKIEKPYISEIAALALAADAAAARRKAIEELEGEIQRRTEQLKGDHLRLVADHPVLGRLVPTPPSGEEAPQARVAKRAGRRS